MKNENTEQVEISKSLFRRIAKIAKANGFTIRETIAFLVGFYERVYREDTKQKGD